MRRQPRIELLNPTAIMWNTLNSAERREEGNLNFEAVAVKPSARGKDVDKCLIQIRIREFSCVSQKHLNCDGLSLQ